MIRYTYGCETFIFLLRGNKTKESIIYYLEEKYILWLYGYLYVHMKIIFMQSAYKHSENDTPAYISILEMFSFYFFSFKTGSHYVVLFVLELSI